MLTFPLSPSHPFSCFHLSHIFLLLPLPFSPLTPLPSSVQLPRRWPDHHTAWPLASANTHTWLELTAPCHYSIILCHVMSEDFIAIVFACVLIQFRNYFCICYILHHFTKQQNSWLCAWLYVASMLHYSSILGIVFVIISILSFLFFIILPDNMLNVDTVARTGPYYSVVTHKNEICMIWQDDKNLHPLRSGK